MVRKLLFAASCVSCLTLSLNAFKQEWVDKAIALSNLNDIVHTTPCRITTGHGHSHLIITNGRIHKERELMNADLSDAKLPGINLAEAILIGANLAHADLAGADLHRAVFEGIVFGPEVDEDGFSRNHKIYANLVGANLAGANLSDAKLNGVNLSNNNLTVANLQVAELFEANLAGAILIGADLLGANLAGADLSNTDLTGANLKNVNLTGDSSTNGNMRGGIWEVGEPTNPTSLTNANFSGVTGLTNAQKNYARAHGAINVPADNPAEAQLFSSHYLDHFLDHIERLTGQCESDASGETKGGMKL